VFGLYREDSGVKRAHMRKRVQVSLKMTTAILYRIALFWTDVSENVSFSSTGVLRSIGFHSCITVETLYSASP
jgi:hypothetical protein